MLDTVLASNLHALSFNLTRTLESMYICIIIIPILQMRKLGSDKLTGLRQSYACVVPVPPTPLTIVLTVMFYDKETGT